MGLGGVAVGRQTQKSRPAEAGREWGSLARFALLCLSIAAAGVVWVTWYGGGEPSDAYSFYHPTYEDRVFATYIWSPAFAQVTAPLRLLPYDMFVGLVRGLELAALVAMVPYGAWIAVFLPPVATEINAANINLLLALCVVLSFRYPAAWTLALLTKPSIALGSLWFPFRGEWRRFAQAVVPAVVIAAVSFALDPGAWAAYLGAFGHYSDAAGWPFPVPIWPRIPIVLALVWWGARTNRPWMAALGAILALPRLYFMSPAMLVALVPLMRRRA